MGFRHPGLNGYNFEVAGLHNYLVSDAGVLVHNDCGQKPKGKTISVIQGTGLNAKKVDLVIPKGYKKTNLTSHGQPVYSNGKKWITPDKDGHNGGAWKMYDNAKDVGGGKGKRTGTFDKDLNEIGK